MHMMPVLDLKKHSEIGKPSRRFFSGGNVYVFRPTCVYPNYGLHAFENLSALRCKISRQLQREALYLHGSFPYYGFCTIDISRKPSGYRSLPASTKQKTLSHGHTEQSFPQHLGGGQRGAGLAYLCRFCQSSNQHRQKALPKGTDGRRTPRHDLRIGCHDDRPMSFPLSLGAFPESKGCGPTSYPYGSSGQYPELYPHLRRKTPRGQRLGYHPSGGRRFLHYGSRLSGLLQALYGHPGLSILRYTGQVESEVPQALLPSGGQIHRCYLRSNHSADHSQVGRGLSRQAPPSEILRCRDRQNLGISDQQLSAAGCHHCTALQTAMADRALLQVDQAEPAHQELLRHFGERCEDPNLDRRFCISDRGDYQKTFEYSGKSLHNFTGFERLPI